MNIEITARQLSGCTDFIAKPARLHLGSQNAEGVDTLAFRLPAAWAGKSVSLHLEQQDGTLPSPLLLDADGCVAVDRRLTAASAGRWMLAATDGAGYTAYTQPGSYDAFEVLPTEGDGEPPSDSLYEQFVAQVLANAVRAESAAGSAAQSADGAGSAAVEAAAALSGAEVQAAAASASAGRAEAAALRAEAVAPEGGAVVSVNSKGGIVTLGAADVGALPLPETAAAGQLLRIRSVDEASGAVTTEAVEETELSGFVRHTDIPTASFSGPIRLDSGYGLALTGSGELRLAPATSGHLEGMEDAWAPLTAALMPLAVKLALSCLWPGAGWTEADQSAARETLGAADAGTLAALSARVTALELKYGTSVTEHSFAAGLDALDSLRVSGIWNAAQARLEF